MNEINPDWCEKIEAYLKEEMTPEERFAFESEMSGNEELSAVFRLYSTIETEMRKHEQYAESEAALKNTLGKLSAHYSTIETGDEPPGFEPEKEEVLESVKSEEERKVRKIKSWKWFAIAAVTTGIIVLSITWYLQNASNKTAIVAGNKGTDSAKNIHKTDTGRLEEKPPSSNIAQDKKVEKSTAINPSELFAANFKPDVTPTDKEGPLEDALVYYEKKAYKDAINAIEHADMNLTRGLDTDEKLTEFYAAYYKALSYMADNNVSKAIPELKNAMTIRPDNLSYVKAQWYLALAYLKTGDLKSSENLLEQIVRNDHEKKYRSQAIALMNELKK